MSDDRTTELIERVTYHAGMAYATLRELEMLRESRPASNEGVASCPRKDTIERERS